jgi:Asp-tRNA(Asn)/Glu-tRNA(Gln) amidotransferase A subunit family amidase
MNLEDRNDQTLESPSRFRVHLEEQLANIKASNSTYNALIRSYLSLETLPKVYQQLEAKKNGLPLFGLTFSVKDCLRVERQPMTFGLNPPLHASAKNHAEIVALCIRVGATLIGSTTMDPAGINCFGNNPEYGKTLNPLTRERVPIGSSAGSASSVAADFCDFSIATDSSGDVRAPAAACGIVGIKFSRTLFSCAGSLLLSSSLDSLGFMAKTIDDIDYLTRTLISDEKIPSPLVQPLFLLPEQKELEQLNSDYEAAFATLCSVLKDKGLARTLDFPIGYDDAEDIRRKVAASDFHELMQKLNLRTSLLPEAAQSMLALERSLSPQQKEIALDLKVNLTEKIATILDENTFLLTPSLPSPPPTWEESQRGRGSLPSVRTQRFLSLANVSESPAISLPISGLQAHAPFSCQVIGKHGNDIRSIEAARLLAEQFSTP